MRERKRNSSHYFFSTPDGNPPTQAVRFRALSAVSSPPQTGLRVPRIPQSKGHASFSRLSRPSPYRGIPEHIAVTYTTDQDGAFAFVECLSNNRIVVLGIPLEVNGMTDQRPSPLSQFSPSGDPLRPPQGTPADSAFGHCYSTSQTNRVAAGRPG